MNSKQFILCSAFVFCGFATASEEMSTNGEKMRKVYDVRTSKTEKFFERSFNKPSEIVNKQGITAVKSPLNASIYVYDEVRNIYFSKTFYHESKRCAQFKKSDDPEMLHLTELPESDCKALNDFANQVFPEAYLSVEKKA